MCAAALMPPKLSPTQLDSKLEALRDYVHAHLAELASVSKRTLKAVFAKQKNYMERNFYQFLYTNERNFTEAQQRHGEETLALLLRYCDSSGDAHPAASSKRRQSDRSRCAIKHHIR